MTRRCLEVTPATSRRWTDILPRWTMTLRMFPRASGLDFGRPAARFRTPRTEACMISGAVPHRTAGKHFLHIVFGRINAFLGNTSPMEPITVHSQSLVPSGKAKMFFNFPL